jgi:hypothetical protein
MSERISQAQYNADFEEQADLKQDAGKKKAKKAAALDYALEIRKFEIELYWKRATYFWAFIVATLAGYGAAQASSLESRTDLSVFLACLGVVFSWGWFLVNKGSKQWQENWENHVDLLEDEVVGPLYKIVLKRAAPVGFKRHVKRWVTGPGPFSVSKINQIISLFVTVLWVFLLWKALPPFSKTASINWEYVGIIAAALATCVLFVVWGATESEEKNPEPRRLIARKRKSGIDP